MKLPNLNVTQDMIKGYHGSNKGFGIIITVPENTVLMSGMTLTLGALSFKVNCFDGLNPNNNTYIFSLCGNQVFDLLMAKSFNNQTECSAKTEALALRKGFQAGFIDGYNTRSLDEVDGFDIDQCTNQYVEQMLQQVKE